MRLGVLVALAASLALASAEPAAVGSTNTADFQVADKDQDGVVSPLEFKQFLHPTEGAGAVSWFERNLTALFST